MTRFTRLGLRAGVFVLGICLSAVGAARAATVVWDVDPSASFVRLTIPDQVVNVSGIGEVTVRLRDASSTSQWTDAGGRRTALDGEITTDYVNFTSIEFVGGVPGMYALEQISLRPNPAQWDAAAAMYTGSGTAPAALGARVRGTYLAIFNFDAAFVAFRSVWFDIASGTIPLSQTGAFPGNLTRFALPFALSDVDGQELPLGLGQPIPDLLQQQLPSIDDLNTSGGIIENLGGPNRKLTYPISMPIALELESVVLTGSVAGQIVAYATIPPQSIPFDFEGDGDVDRDDYAAFQACSTGAAIAGPPPGCTPDALAIGDADHDLDVDQDDFGAFQRCYSGKDIAAQPSCAQ